MELCFDLSTSYTDFLLSLHPEILRRAVRVRGRRDLLPVAAALRALQRGLGCPVCSITCAPAITCPRKRPATCIPAGRRHTSTRTGGITLPHADHGHADPVDTRRRRTPAHRASRHRTRTDPAPAGIRSGLRYRGGDSRRFAALRRRRLRPAMSTLASSRRFSGQRICRG